MIAPDCSFVRSFVTLVLISRKVQIGVLLELRRRAALRRCDRLYSSTEPCRLQIQIQVRFLLARDSMLSALYAIARPSVCPSVTRVDQSKTVEVIPLVFVG